MTPELATAIEGAMKLQELEDLYLPYRPKKRTRASIARERGLESLAQLMLADTTEDTTSTIESLTAPFITEEVPDSEAALQGAMDIVAEDVSAVPISCVFA